MVITKIMRYEMLGENGFDIWADGYDECVKEIDKNNGYPFAGYKDVLNKIYNSIMPKKRAIILDIGFGTATLTKRLYDNNHIIYGLDFSQKMVDISKEKMPKAKLYKADFGKDLPEEIKKIKFDYIISTYAIHHLNDNEKIKLINSLKQKINKKGAIIIGDVSFKNRKKRMECQTKYNNDWDNDEYYYCYDEIKLSLNYENKKYYQVSECAGILILNK